MIRKLRLDFVKHRLTYIFLGLLLSGAFFVRIYKINENLGFWFDQGRDALVIWKFWHEGDFFLIGPTTGIEGIFRGPWYYWLIAPFYLLGGGNPVWPSVFLSFTTVVGLFALFFAARRIGGEVAGLLAVFLGGFSYNILLASRWLSNPTPMLAISMLLVWSLFLVIDGKKWAWIMLAFLVGQAMQFGSSTEVFLFPALFIFMIWQRGKLPGLKIAAFSILAFFITVLPQIIFDIKHDGVLRGAVLRFLFEQESFQLSFLQILKERTLFYYQMFFSKVFPNKSALWLILLAALCLKALFFRKALFANSYFPALLLFFTSPILGMYFFQGNYGNVYDYYFTGYYLFFILIVAVVISASWRYLLGKLAVLLFVLFFINSNYLQVKAYMQSGMGLVLKHELDAVSWVFKEASGRSFNVDVYVPPVIPYAYDYLFLWQGTERCGESLCSLKLEERVPLLYTVEEPDPGHPDRVEAWRARQAGIGVIEETVEFGGILVERRSRLNNGATRLPDGQVEQ